jgi:predicted Fe-Mo cluster-binding NifX family protein
MKIFFTVEDESGLKANIDERFARAPFFLVYDTDKEEIVLAQENPFRHDDHGVGVRVGNFVLQNDCQAVVGSKFGPKLENILKSGGVKMIQAEGGKDTVRAVLDRLQAEI